VCVHGVSDEEGGGGGAPVVGHPPLPSLAFSAWLTRELICISGVCVGGDEAAGGRGGVFARGLSPLAGSRLVCVCVCVCVRGGGGNRALAERTCHIHVAPLIRPR